MSVDLKYLAKLLANGVSQAQSAAAVGCTPGYVAQLLSSDNTMQKLLQEEEAKLAIVHIKRTQTLGAIEKDLLSKVHELVPYSESLGEATTALQKIAEMKDRRALAASGGQRTGNVIELNLGKLADSKLEVAMGDNKVIMHLGGMNMARAPSTKIKDMLEARKAITNDSYNTEKDNVWEVPDRDASGM